MTSCCLLFGSLGAIGKHLYSCATTTYDVVIPYDISLEGNNYYCDLSKQLDLSLLFEPLLSYKTITHIDLVFAQRPFLNLSPSSHTEDIHTAIDITCLSPILLVEYLSSQYPSSLRSISFIGSINSTLVCDQPLSYMISKSASDIAVRFLSNRFPDFCFRNFVLGLVDVPSKDNCISKNPLKLKSAYAAVGKQVISSDQDLASIIVKSTFDFCLPLSGSTTHLDNGQHFTDPFWSARIK